MRYPNIRLGPGLSQLQTLLKLTPVSEPRLGLDATVTFKGVEHFPGRQLSAVSRPRGLQSKIR